MVKKAAHTICDQIHVLNSCNKTNSNFYRMPRTRRFLESLVPFSIQLLHSARCPHDGLMEGK